MNPEVQPSESTQKKPEKPEKEQSYPSLFVGDLHVDVTETFLYEIFEEYGSIVSIRVCRDTITRDSLGYAFVNFQRGQDAERALESLNYTVIKEKTIRIMWAQPELETNIVNLPIKDQKHLIAEQLFPIVFQNCQLEQNDEAGKVTKMFLEMDTSDLLQLLQSPEILEAKIQEARRLFHDHENEQEGEITSKEMKEKDSKIKALEMDIVD